MATTAPQSTTNMSRGPSRAKTAVSKPTVRFAESRALTAAPSRAAPIPPSRAISMKSMNPLATAPTGRHPNQLSCGYPPIRPLTKEDIVKARSRSRRGDDALNPLRRHDFDKHRERVLSAKPMIDTSNPLVNRNMYSSPTNFNRAITNFVRIERENARMLERIAIIMKSDATVDNRLRSNMNPINVLGKAREMNLLRLAFDNLEMYRRIQAVKPEYERKQQLKDYDRMEKVMEELSFYPLFWKISGSNGYERLREQAMANAKYNPRPKVFLNLETDEETLGQIIIELRADVVPMTAENFRCLCTGEMGLSYKCTELHRIIPDILWQGGNVVGRDGHGGKSIYGDTFPDENFKLKHSEAGIVSMANSGKDTNGSQFLITANRLGALDGVNVVFGRVIKGLALLRMLKEFVSASGMIRKKIWISECGSMDDGDMPPPTAAPSQIVTLVPSRAISNATSTTSSRVVSIAPSATGTMQSSASRPQTAQTLAPVAEEPEPESEPEPEPPAPVEPEATTEPESEPEMAEE